MLPGADDCHNGAGAEVMNSFASHQTPLDRLDMGRCNGCGRDIIWAISPAGAKLPLDARPAAPHLYALALVSGRVSAVRLAYAINEHDQPEIDAREPDRVFVSHWLTCPNPPRR